MATTTRYIHLRQVTEQLTPQQKLLQVKQDVFKYYMRDAEQFILEQGSIRIGTLQKYRTIENTALCDEQEGLRIARAEDIVFWSGQAVTDKVSTTSPMFSWVKSNIGNFAQGDISISGIEFIEQMDFYIYSFSYECTPSVVKSFSDMPFDCVAKIGSIHGLAELLVKIHPNLKGLFYAISPVVYRDRYRSPSDDHPSPLVEAFEKDCKFSANQEGRIVFFEFNPATRAVKYDLRAIAIPDDFSSPLIKTWFQKWSMPTASA